MVWLQQIDFTYTRHNSQTKITDVTVNGTLLWNGSAPTSAGGTFSVSRNGIGQALDGPFSFAAGTFPINLSYDKNNGLVLTRVVLIVTTGDAEAYNGSNGCMLVVP